MAAEQKSPGSVRVQNPCEVCSGELSPDQPAACPHSVCVSCLGDKGCPKCPQSPVETDPAHGPEQNGTAEVPDPNPAEQIKVHPDEPEEQEESEPPLGPEDVVCDSCIESPCRAQKSCLTCLVSYCQSHLRPHLENPKFQNHRLVEPLRDIERRSCEVHKWPLEGFCCSDLRCVCRDCVTAEHPDHDTVPVREARARIEAGSGSVADPATKSLLLCVTSFKPVTN